jgi:primosomal protein N' (replication factor Y)
MLFAKVVVGLPVSGPFDYIVPSDIESKISVGSRVQVSFGVRKLVGYVVGLSKKSELTKLKPILKLIDETPLLNKELLLLTRQLCDYYSCSWGEAIETALPENLRRGRQLGPISLPSEEPPPSLDSSLILLHDLDGRARMGIYFKEIEAALKNNCSTLLIFPDIPELLGASQKIKEHFGFEAALLYRKQPSELNVWADIKAGREKIVLGTRSAIFAPLNNLGLIIVESEENSVYKQDQVPHYHARQVAVMRSEINGAKLILGSRSPSLESYCLAKKNKFQYTVIPRSSKFPEIKIIDTRHLSFPERKKGQIISRLLEDAIYSVLCSKDNISGASGKVLLFLNRKGFATSAACQSCGKVLKCPRCNVNLVYHFSGNLLRCHYCNYKIEPPKICPDCNAGYIKFSGTGTEKIESELSRVFPTARVKILDEKVLDLNGADIFISTSSVIRRTDLLFDLIGVLGIDNVLNRVDFRSTEKVFEILAGLVSLANRNLIIQTSSPGHHCFQALLKKDEAYFYEEELKQRKQLDFPPFKHMVLIKLRGKNESKVKDACETLFHGLAKESSGVDPEIVSFNPSNPPKLRGNFYWQILLRSAKVSKAGEFLRKSLKNFRHSGIIITIDVDPL